MTTCTTDLRIWDFLAARADATGVVRVSRTAMALGAPMSKQTVEVALTRLRSAGAIRFVDTPRYRTWTYQVLERPAEPTPELVDEVVVVRLVAGDRVPATKAEKVEAVRVLALRGWSDPEMADRLGVVPRTILRWRQAASIPSGWAA